MCFVMYFENWICPKHSALLLIVHSGHNYSSKLKIPPWPHEGLSTVKSLWSGWDLMGGTCRTSIKACIQ